ncbi:hypothetical protein CY35_10G065400 [Sphagnum magellanicum]|nr:hypothetical protein CY35_10G065400 [Sphagnum magellanicum]
MQLPFFCWIARKYTESGVYVLDRAGLQLFAWELSEKVGTKFNKGTSKLGSILSDRLVECLKDKSAGAISTFGYTLPVWAAGLSSPAQARSPNLFCAESHIMNSWKEEIYQQREYGKASFLRKPDHQAVLFAALSFCIQGVSP